MEIDSYVTMVITSMWTVGLYICLMKIPDATQLSDEDKTALIYCPTLLRQVHVLQTDDDPFL